MAKIKVDYGKMDSAVSAVEAYVDLMKKKMSDAQKEVDTLAASWQGADFAQFKTQWNTIVSNNSTYSQMLKSLQSYADFLKLAKKKYKNAQANAVNRANWL